MAGVIPIFAERINKRILDGRTAEALGLDLADVEFITKAFIDEARHALAYEGEIHLNGLGLLRQWLNKALKMSPALMARSKTSMCNVDKVYVYFSKSAELQREIKEANKQGLPVPEAQQAYREYKKKERET